MELKTGISSGCPPDLSAYFIGFSFLGAVLTTLSAEDFTLVLITVLPCLAEAFFSIGVLKNYK